ncbi:hypothetical protein QML27_28880, partial [Klebsiella pneumoniae]
MSPPVRPSAVNARPLRIVQHVRRHLGPDPLAADFDRDALARILAGQRTQVKGLLRDQSVLAGVGNAYSDEVLHAARLSPYALAATLSDAQVDELYAALRSVLT